MTTTTTMARVRPPTDSCCDPSDTAELADVGAKQNVGEHGDGEANINGIEMGLHGTFELIVRKDMSLKVPRAETPTHYILGGFDPILDNSAKMALRETIDFLGELRGMSRDDAYSLCSLAVDLHVTQIVNGYKGVHAMVPKSLFE